MNRWMSLGKKKKKKKEKKKHFFRSINNSSLSESDRLSNDGFRRILLSRCRFCFFPFFVPQNLKC